MHVRRGLIVLLSLLALPQFAHAQVLTTALSSVGGIIGEIFSFRWMSGYEEEFLRFMYFILLYTIVYNVGMVSFGGLKFPNTKKFATVIAMVFALTAAIVSPFDLIAFVLIGLGSFIPMILGLLVAFGVLLLGYNLLPKRNTALIQPKDDGSNFGMHFLRAIVSLLAASIVLALMVVLTVPWDTPVNIDTTGAVWINGTLELISYALILLFTYEVIMMLLSIGGGLVKGAVGAAKGAADVAGGNSGPGGWFKNRRDRQGSEEPVITGLSAPYLNQDPANPVLALTIQGRGLRGTDRVTISNGTDTLRTAIIKSDSPKAVEITVDTITSQAGAPVTPGTFSVRIHKQSGGEAELTDGLQIGVGGAPGPAPTDFAAEILDMRLALNRMEAEVAPTRAAYAASNWPAMGARIAAFNGFETTFSTRLNTIRVGSTSFTNLIPAQLAQINVLLADLVTVRGQFSAAIRGAPAP